MARLKPDSDDDDFPELAQLARRAKVKKTSSSRDNETVVARKEERGEDPKKMETGYEKRLSREVEVVKEREKTGSQRPKKRVLNQKSDNPLLRPLSLSTSSRVPPDTEASDGSVKVRASEVKAKNQREAVVRGLEVSGSDIVVHRTVSKSGKETRTLPPGYPRLAEKKSVTWKGENGDWQGLLEAGVSRSVLIAKSSDQRSERAVILPGAKDMKPPAKQEAVLVPHSYTEHDTSADVAGLTDNDSTFSKARSAHQRTMQDTNLPKSKQPRQTSHRVKQEATTMLHSDTEQHDSDTFYECNTRDTSSSQGRSQDMRIKQDSILPKIQPKPSASKSKQRSIPTIISDTEQDDSDNMSDFIVNDSTFLDDGESVLEIPPPRSVRRLVQGRRPRRTSSSDEDLDLDLDFKMERLNFVEEKDLAKRRDGDALKGLGDLVDEFSSDDDEEDGIPAFKLPEKKVVEKPQSEVTRPAKKTEAPPPPTQKPASRPTTSGSEIDNPFTLKFSPPRRPLSPPRQSSTITASPTTPPLSPLKPRGLISPSKPRTKLCIPATPHRQSSDAFWAQDVINDWNDSYSPSKPLSPRAPSPAKNSPTKPPSKFQAGPVIAKDARARKKRFEDTKNETAERFLRDLDHAITGGKIGELAKETGGVRVVWSKKLNTTAGRANWKRETLRSPVPGEKEMKVVYRHHASIELASKVINSLPRLLNVVAHEYCHLANFMISGVKTNPHGREFKVWAARVTSWGQRNNVCTARGGYGCGVDGDGVGTGGGGGDDGEEFEVTTKHSYEIEYKYAWSCGCCAVVYQRHSKSIDPTRHRCGTCKGVLIQTKPVPRVGGGAATAAGAPGIRATAVGGSDGGGKDGVRKGKGTGDAGIGGEKKLTAYQLFVKQNMALIRAANPGSPHKEVMGEVGRRFREMQGRLGGERTMDKGLGGVVRKLEFLDLSGDSP